MVDGQVRRTLKRSVKPTVISSEPISGDEHVTIDESGTVTAADTSAIGDDNEPFVERNRAQRIGVVEVDPERIGEFINERAAGSGSGDSSGERRTRRARSDSGKPRNKRRGKETPPNVEALVTMVHTWASVILKTPELMLEPTEVKQLSDAYTTFSEFHEVPILTEKRVSEINLIATVCAIYGTRFVAISKRKKEQKKTGAFHVMPTRDNVAHNPVN